MTQKQNPKTPQSSNKVRSKKQNQESQNNLDFFIKTGNFLDGICRLLMGDLRKDVYETIRDAIALYFLLIIPGCIGKSITGKDYSGFDQCINDWTQWDVNRYACFVIVASGFTLWIVIAGRIIFRFIKNLREL